MTARIPPYNGANDCGALSMVRLSNVYYMLAYAYRSLNERELLEIEGEQFEHIHDLFAAILVRGVSSLIRRGLNRGYVACEEMISAPRGAIDFSTSVRQNTLRRRELYCRYDEYTEDVPVNRALKAVMRVLLLHGSVKGENRTALRRLMDYFAGVHDIRPADIRFDELRLTRDGGAYALLLGVCELIVKGLLMTDKSGQIRLRGFVDDQHMYRLYEKFILNYYKKNWLEFSPSPRFVPWNLQFASAPDLMPAMKTDVTLLYGDRMLIIDAKCYENSLQYNGLFGSSSLISNHLYQLFTYVKNASNKLKVSGMLLYARTDEPLSPDGDYTICGSDISIRSLDLSQKWQSIQSTLDGVASRFIEGSVIP